MAYSKQTWDTTSYVNPTRMNHIEEGIEAAASVADTANNRFVFIETGTGKTIREYLDAMADNTIAYTSYLTYFTDASNYQALGFSQYSNVTLTRINQWAEKVEITSTKGLILGFWVGNKNDTDIVNDMSVYKLN